MTKPREPDPGQTWLADTLARERREMLDALFGDTDPEQAVRPGIRGKSSDAQRRAPEDSDPQPPPMP